MNRTRLTPAVRAGEISDYKTLKSEYRRLSLLVHPDTSQRDDAEFVRLKSDFDEATRLLKLMRPLAFLKTGPGDRSRGTPARHPSGEEPAHRGDSAKRNAGQDRPGKRSESADSVPFDQSLFLELIKRAHTIGLPSRKLSLAPQNQRLIHKIKKEAFKMSEGLLVAVQLYYGFHDRVLDHDISSQHIKHKLQGGISNFLDAHYNGNPGSARIAVSFFDDAQNHMSKVPGSVFSYMLPFVDWMRKVIAESRMLG